MAQQAASSARAAAMRAEALGSDGSANQAAPVCVGDYEAAAQRAMSATNWEFFSSGAADELTLGWNREAYNRLRLRPRVLVDVSRIDTSTTLLGKELAHPILLAPVADHRMIHAEGELATARAAGSTRTPLVLSSCTNTRIEEVVAAASSPLWFQVYVQQDRGFTRAMVQRAVAAGAEALCVTVDSPTFGARDRQARSCYDLSPGVTRPHMPEAARSEPGENGIFPDWTEPSLTWKDIDWLRAQVNVPVLLKGVLNPDDAQRAAEEGIAGIIVSNHGARNLDTVPATIEALPLVAERVQKRMAVLVDGGIRRGTDIVKALALGADAVLIGRPYVYGLAAGGEEGVRRVIQILRSELEMAMGLLGKADVRSLDRSVLWE
jgi:4-hydroxymandelate oxidase